MKTTRRYFFSVIVPAFAAAGLVLVGLSGPRPAAATQAVTRPAVASQAITLTLATGAEALNYNLSWTAITVVPAASFYYLVSSTFGLIYPLNTTTNGLGTYVTSTATTESLFFEKTSAVIGNIGPGSRCFIVEASTSPAMDPLYGRSGEACHSFFGATGASEIPTVDRVDGEGGQTGFGQIWRFTYFIDRDALVSLRIFQATSTLVQTDSKGFAVMSDRNKTGLPEFLLGGNPANPTEFEVLLSTSIIKTVTDKVPRSGERSGASVSNTETWDMRDSSGAVVTNGIYYANFFVTSPLLTPTTRFAEVFTVPVDTLRILDFTTVGITPTSALASIRYKITGDAAVRILIARPGRQFALDAFGTILAKCPPGATNCTASPTLAGTDISTNSVVQIITFNRKAGSYTESWNGQDTLGVAVSSNIYSVGISAIDGFGNHAVDSSGQETAQATTIPVERAASQTAGDTTAPVVTAITVNGSSILTGVATLTASFDKIEITLGEDSGTGINETSVALALAPGAVSQGGAVAIPGTGGTLRSVTYSSATVLATTGTYTVTVTPRDASGNSATQTFSFLLASATSASTKLNQEQFQNSLIPGPNPVREAPAKFNFRLSQASSVTIELFTLTGERVFLQTQPFAAGAQAFEWSITNSGGSRVGSGVYLLRISANDGSSTLVATKKIMVIK